MASFKHLCSFSSHDNLGRKIQFVESRVNQLAHFGNVIFGVKRSQGFHERRNVPEVFISENFESDFRKFVANQLRVVCAQKPNRESTRAAVIANDYLFAFAVENRISRFIDKIPPRFILNLFHCLAIMGKK